MIPRAPYRTSPEGLAALATGMHVSFKLFAPPLPLTLSQWADRYAYLSKESSASPGKFQTAAFEYQRGIMDAITDPNIQTLALMLAAQSGKTQSAVLNTIGYYSHWEPSPILCVQPSLSEAEKFSKNRIAKMIRDTPVLRGLYPSPRSRDSGNTLLNKEFPGGILVLVGANAPVGLRGLPVRIVIMDEVDGYEESAGTEGDPVDLARKRATKFWNRKIILISTPHIKNLSRIEKAYDSSDMRRYYVPCPHCGEMQVLEWKRLQWKTKTTGPTSRPRVIQWHYVCVNGCVIEERSKHEMIRRGQWRATAESHDGKTAGFQLNALYGVVDWADLISDWLEAQGDLEAMKVFVNTNLAETWEIRGTGANKGDLESRPRFNRELLPGWLLFLTAGVDVQDNRLECSIWGWGLDGQRGIVDHRVFMGDPSLPDTDKQSPWAALREYLMAEWEHTGGGEGARLSMHVVCALVDSGGHHTERVYEFTRKHEARRWYAIVGRAGIGKPLASSGNRVGPQSTLLYTVGTDTAKEDIFTSFRVKEPGAGYCYFSDDLPDEYFRQVTAEKMVKTVRDFQTTMIWVKTSERNEALDCAVYARAAVAVLRPNFRKVAKNLFAVIEEQSHRRQPAPRPPDPAEETLGAAVPAPVDSEQCAVNSEPEAPMPPAEAPRPRRKRPSVANALQSALNRR